MFYDISLCPGGAFMMHESAAEYDPNMVRRVPEVAPQTVNALKVELSNPSCDPVHKLINKTRPIYEKIQILGRLDLEPNNIQSAISDLETVSKMASEVAEEMRLRLVKQAALFDLMENAQYDWHGEAITANMKTLMLNKARINQMGYSRCVAEYNELRQVTAYNVQTMLSAYIAMTPELPDYPFDMDRMRDSYKSGYAEGLLDCFASTLDMFRCIYEDYDRLIRLEVPNSQTTDLNDLLNNATWRHTDRLCNERRTICSDERYFYSSLVAHISHILRKVKRGCYEMSCELMEPDAMLDRECYHKRMRSLISGVYDIFYLSMIWLFSNAYRLRRYIAMRDAVTRYVETTLKALNSH